MASKTLTAPLALIKSNGVTIGKMQSVNVTETTRRGRVSGIGRLTADELPALEYSCTFNCNKYLIEYKKTIFPNQPNREVQKPDDFVNQVIFDEGVQVDLMRKEKTGVDANGNVITELKVFASIKKAVQTTDGFSINEGNIGSRNASFEYPDPILFPL